jgi:hypothetical protein
MPRRTTGLRRRAPISDVSPEQVEVLISGDWEYGAIVPRRPELGGRAFRDLAHAEEVWRANREFILKLHRKGWRAEDGEATLWVEQSSWLFSGQGCWAEDMFGAP